MNRPQRHLIVATTADWTDERRRSVRSFPPRDPPLRIPRLSLRIRHVTGALREDLWRFLLALSDANRVTEFSFDWPLTDAAHGGTLAAILRCLNRMAGVRTVRILNGTSAASAVSTDSAALTLGILGPNAARRDAILGLPYNDAQFGVVSSSAAMPRILDVTIIRDVANGNRFWLQVVAPNTNLECLCIRDAVWLSPPDLTHRRLKVLFLARASRPGGMRADGFSQTGFSVAQLYPSALHRLPRADIVGLEFDRPPTGDVLNSLRTLWSRAADRVVLIGKYCVHPNTRDNGWQGILDAWGTPRQRLTFVAVVTVLGDREIVNDRHNASTTVDDPLTELVWRSHVSKSGIPHPTVPGVTRAVRARHTTVRCDGGGGSCR